MRSFLYLVKRNMMVYYRDKGNLFFSFLSMLVILGLMLVFLGDMNVTEITDLLDRFGGTGTKGEKFDHASNLVVNWVVAGIIVVNCITIANAVTGIMIADEEEHKLAAFMITPMNRFAQILSYTTAAGIMSMLFCSITLFAAEGFIWMQGGSFITIQDHIVFFGYLLVVVFFSVSLVFFLAQFVHSKSAYSGLSTVVGTLVGFLAAIYVPYGSLPEAAGNILKHTPLFAASSLFRDLFTKDIVKQTFDGVHNDVILEYREFMGIVIVNNDVVTTHMQQILFLLISGIILLIFSFFMMQKRELKDR